MARCPHVVMVIIAKSKKKKKTECEYQKLEPDSPDFRINRSFFQKND